VGMSRSLLTISVSLCALLVASIAPGLAWARRVVSYRGASVAVPHGWPVIDLAADPSACVRFDRPAVYVGEPSAQQSCPANAVGRNRAILIEPRGRGAAIVHSAAAVAPVAGRARIAGVGTVTPGGPYTGLGFDACSAPSLGRMAAWLASPFRAVGIYVGGANMACAQRNLNAAWVQTESAAGWHLVPTYVGLQAPRNSCGCRAISPGQATAEGNAAATDAAGRAYNLGIGRGNPIYLDIESYPRTAVNTSAVLSFVAAWTTQLHAYGYRAGVYGNSDSLMADLVAEAGTSYPEPDDIWFADWDGVPNSTTAWVPADEWVGHRLHQFRGGHRASYGGVSIDIDTSYLNGDTAGASTIPGPIPDGTFVEVAGTTQLYRIAGGAPLPVSDWSVFGGPQPLVMITPQQFAELNPVPLSGTFLQSSTGALYRVAGGAPLPFSTWSLFGGVEPAIGIDDWDIENLTDPDTHLNAIPADGTIVEGLPSQSYWTFRSGFRIASAVNPFATQVADTALDAYPELPCVVPRIARMRLARARVALRSADCRVGFVHWLRRPTHRHPRHVIAQSEPSGVQLPPLSAVALTMR
jgi:Domain of unknown function (DUF1906)